MDASQPEKAKGKGGRPAGRSPILKSVLLRPKDFAALAHIADQTGEKPERVARSILIAALWRSPESLLAEVNRIALEKAADAGDDEGENDSEESAADAT